MKIEKKDELKKVDKDHLRELLLFWFKKAARDLPWRKTRDPYAIWLSEIMLQQTRVDTVIPYYLKFRECYPSVDKLAEASLDDVLHLWSGLGYYRRARMMHVASKEIASRAVFPKTKDEWLSVTGVGPYTAGALASIAACEVTPLVDGNVTRVLSRLFCLEDDMRSKEGQEKVWALAHSLVHPQHPGDWNQALMELGATLCTPKKPQCLICPVSSYCLAKTKGMQLELPRLSAKKKPLEESLTSLVLLSNTGRVFLAKRKEHVRFGGMVEPPCFLGKLPLKTLCKELNVIVSGAKKCAAVTHILSHRRITVHIFLAQYENEEGEEGEEGSVEKKVGEGKGKAKGEGRGKGKAKYKSKSASSHLEFRPHLPELYDSSFWATPDEMLRYGLSRLAKKILANTTHFFQQEKDSHKIEVNLGR